jgi:uncharacterized membrane protein YsdA (DUF1294 family)
MFKILLCLLYGLPAVAAVAWITETLHNSLALGWTLAYLVAINIVTFAVYVFDKVFVGLLEVFRVRVPEDFLVWGLAFPGGWGGALTAMAVADHKTGPDTADFRVKLLIAYAVSATLVVLVLVLVRQPLALLEQADAMIAYLVALVMNVVRTALEAVKARA